MAKVKTWEAAIGERTHDPADEDVLLSDKVSERRRKQITRQEEEDEAAHRARMAELAKKTVTSEAAVEKSGEKKDESVGFKITGGMNLGNIDYPAMLQKQIDERDELRRQAEESAGRQQQVSEELREKLHASEMEVLKTSFTAQMQLLTKMIESNASRGGFAEQLAAARETAKELGFSQGQPNGGSEMIQLELKKLDFEQAVALRRLNREEKESDKKWQLELRRLDDEREVRKAELARDAKKDEMFAKAPEVLGRAFGRAIVESGGDSGDITEQPQHPVGKMPGITAGIGQSGETECIKCQQPVAVGATARKAVCANCGATYPIKRVQSSPEPEEVTEEE